MDWISKGPFTTVLELEATANSLHPTSPISLFPEEAEMAVDYLLRPG